MGKVQDKHDEFVKRTLRLWQPFSKQELTREDAREICENITSFFSLLRKWADEASGHGSE